MKKITQRVVHSLLSYDSITGIFVWKVNASTRARIGDVAGRISNGERHIGIDGRLYNAAVLAWLYQTGKFPAAYVDHKNRNRDDNSFANLREATRTQNAQNRRAFKNGGSGFKGVSWRKNVSRWIAQITVNKQHFLLGSFQLKESAAIAYDLAAHKNFGEFAVFNFPTSPDRDWILL